MNSTVPTQEKSLHHKQLRESLISVFHMLQVPHTHDVIVETKIVTRTLFELVSILMKFKVKTDDSNDI